MAGCHNVKKHQQKLRTYTGSKDFRHKHHTTVTCIMVLTVF